jgi:two-component system, OmpR family, response regulator
MQNEANQPRVLVVEDDATVRGLLTRHLRKSGFEVAEAGDAETVLNGERSSYDLVLTDVHLPGQSGVELARQLKSESEAPVVFLTGDADKKLAETALDEGAAGYLLKPFEVFELDALVRTALRPFGKKASRTASTAEARALASWKAALQRPEQVVLPRRRVPRRTFRFGFKAFAAVAASLLISWLVGSAALGEGPSKRKSMRLTPAEQSAPASVYVPAVSDGANAR